MRTTPLFAMRSGYAATTLAVAIGTTLVFALGRGQDANWDQLNYHFDIPFLILQGTFWEHIAPSGIQTYLNPLILIPQYIIIRSLPPLLAATTIGVAQAMTFVIAARICFFITGPGPGEGRHLQAFLGFMLCVASPMALSEAGTTIVDLLTAVPVLLAYLLLLVRDEGAASRHSCLGAGLLLGLAAGLKLTNAVYMMGAPAFFLAGQADPRRRATGVAQFLLGVAIGFLAVAGYWHLTLWRRFHNPIFPYANNIFRSPDFPAVGLRDARFLPTSKWDIVRYPLYWLTGGSPTPGLLSPASETDPKDVRFACALFGAPVALAVAAGRGRRRFAALARPETGLLLALAVDYLVWLFIFGIHRYLIPVEILCGAVLLVLTGWVAEGRVRSWLLFLLVILTIGRVHVPSWQRLPWQDHWRTIAPTPLALEGRPLIFLTFVPSAFVALSLPSTARYVDLHCGEINLCVQSDTTASQQLRADLREVPPLFAVRGDTRRRIPPSDIRSRGVWIASWLQVSAPRVAPKNLVICDVLR